MSDSIRININPIDFSTLSPIQNISFGPDCSGSEKMLGLTVEQWSVIEEKMSQSMHPILEMKEKSNLSELLRLPPLTDAERIGLREWMDTLTRPEKMATFIKGYRYPSGVSSLHKKILNSCYQKTLSSIKHLTETMLSFLTDYFSFLNDKERRSKEGYIEEESRHSCARVKVYNATFEEWDLIGKNAGSFARFVMEDQLQGKTEVLRSFCNDCYSVELPLFTQMQHKGLREWTHLLTSFGGLKRLVFKKNPPCYLKTVQKINRILKLLMEIVKWRLKFLANRPVDFNQIFIDEIFPMEEGASKILENRDFNFGVNLCPSTKRSLGLCLEEKEEWQVSLRKANQTVRALAVDLEICRLNRSVAQDNLRKIADYKMKWEECTLAFENASRQANEIKEGWDRILEERSRYKGDLEKCQLTLEKADERGSPQINRTEGAADRVFEERCSRDLETCQVTLEKANEEVKRIKREADNKVKWAVRDRDQYENNLRICRFSLERVDGNKGERRIHEMLQERNQFKKDLEACTLTLEGTGAKEGQQANEAKGIGAKIFEERDQYERDLKKCRVTLQEANEEVKQIRGEAEERINGALEERDQYKGDLETCTLTIENRDEEIVKRINETESRVKEAFKQHTQYKDDLKNFRLDLQMKEQDEVKKVAEKVDKVEANFEEPRRCREGWSVCESRLNRAKEKLSECNSYWNGSAFRRCQEEWNTCESQLYQAKVELWECNLQWNRSDLTNRILELKLDYMETRISRFTYKAVTCMAELEQVAQKLNKTKITLANLTKHYEHEKKLCALALEESRKVEKAHLETIGEYAKRMQHMCIDPWPDHCNTCVSTLGQTIIYTVNRKESDFTSRN